MTEQKKQWWESSVDSGKIAMRVKGVLVAVGPLVLLLAQLLGWDMGQEAWSYITNAIVNAVATIGTLVGVGLSIFGYIRRKK